MSNLVLYLTAVLIWGSTWLAIKFQLGSVAPAVSVSWRFGAAAVLLFAYARWRRLPLAFRPGAHAWLALQGVLLFGVNYLLVYLSERTLPSGIVAVIFSAAVLFNLVGARICFGTRIPRTALAGALLGVAGVALVFSPQIASLSASGPVLWGALLALTATALASTGNLVASRNQRAGMPVLSSTAWAMWYGAVAIALLVLLGGQSLAIEWSVTYVASFAYLTVFGSVIAFTAYLTLMQRVGPGKAGYANVAIPVVALCLSTIFEQLHWRPLMLVGALLCLCGNVLVLRGGGRLRWPRRVPAAPPARAVDQAGGAGP